VDGLEEFRIHSRHGSEKRVCFPEKYQPGYSNQYVIVHRIPPLGGLLSITSTGMFKVITDPASHSPPSEVISATASYGKLRVITIESQGKALVPRIVKVLKLNIEIWFPPYTRG
jgi:hypothetical protein